jgi:hypothetical protein
MVRRRRVRPRIYATRSRPANPTTNLRLQGIAAALGNLAGAQLQPGLAATVLASLGITVADLEAAGADRYDLEPLTAIAARQIADQASKPMQQTLEAVENIANTANPHMWIPYQGTEPYDEVCELCGVFSGAHNQKQDPPAAKLPCPEPWPEWLPDTHEFHRRS